MLDPAVSVGWRRHGRLDISTVEQAQVAKKNAEPEAPRMDGPTRPVGWL